MSFRIESRCADSGKPVNIEIDSDLNLLSVSKGADPFIFVPSVILEKSEEKSIIDIF